MLKKLLVFLLCFTIISLNTKPEDVFAGAGYEPDVYYDYDGSVLSAINGEYTPSSKPEDDVATYTFNGFGNATLGRYNEFSPKYIANYKANSNVTGNGSPDSPYHNACEITQLSGDNQFSLTCRDDSTLRTFNNRYTSIYAKKDGDNLQLVTNLYEAICNYGFAYSNDYKTVNFNIDTNREGNDYTVLMCVREAKKYSNSESLDEKYYELGTINLTKTLDYESGRGTISDPYDASNKTSLSVNDGVLTFANLKSSFSDLDLDKNQYDTNDSLLCYEINEQGTFNKRERVNGRIVYDSNNVVVSDIKVSKSATYGFILGRKENNGYRYYFLGTENMEQTISGSGTQDDPYVSSRFTLTNNFEHGKNTLTLSENPNSNSNGGWLSCYLIDSVSGKKYDLGNFMPTNDGSGSYMTTLEYPLDISGPAYTNAEGVYKIADNISITKTKECVDDLNIEFIGEGDEKDVKIISSNSTFLETITRIECGSKYAFLNSQNRPNVTQEGNGLYSTIIPYSLFTSKNYFDYIFSIYTVDDKYLMFQEYNDFTRPELPYIRLESLPACYSSDTFNPNLQLSLSEDSTHYVMACAVDNDYNKCQDWLAQTRDVMPIYNGRCNVISGVTKEWNTDGKCSAILLDKDILDLTFYKNGNISFTFNTNGYSSVGNKQFQSVTGAPEKKSAPSVEYLFTADGLEIISSDQEYLKSINCVDVLSAGSFGIKLSNEWRKEYSLNTNDIKQITGTNKYYITLPMDEMYEMLKSHLENDNYHSGVALLSKTYEPIGQDFNSLYMLKVYDSIQNLASSSTIENINSLDSLVMGNNSEKKALIKTNETATNVENLQIKGIAAISAISSNDGKVDLSVLSNTEEKTTLVDVKVEVSAQNNSIMSQYTSNQPIKTFDINVSKGIKINPTSINDVIANDEYSKVTELPLNTAITVEVPNDLKNIEVIRLHEVSGNITSSTLTYVDNGIDNNTNKRTITFFTDKFSTFSITTKDAANPSIDVWKENNKLVLSSTDNDFLTKVNEIEVTRSNGDHFVIANNLVANTTNGITTLTHEYSNSDPISNVIGENDLTLLLKTNDNQNRQLNVSYILCKDSFESIVYYVDANDNYVQLNVKDLTPNVLMWWRGNPNGNCMLFYVGGSNGQSPVFFENNGEKVRIYHDLNNGENTVNDVPQFLVYDLSRLVKCNKNHSNNSGPAGGGQGGTPNYINTWSTGSITEQYTFDSQTGMYVYNLGSKITGIEGLISTISSSNNGMVFEFIGKDGSRSNFGTGIQSFKNDKICNITGGPNKEYSFSIDFNTGVVKVNQNLLGLLNGCITEIKFNEEQGGGGQGSSGFSWSTGLLSDIDDNPTHSSGIYTVNLGNLFEQSGLLRFISNTNADLDIIFVGPNNRLPFTVSVSRIKENNQWIFAMENSGPNNQCNFEFQFKNGIVKFNDFIQNYCGSVNEISFVEKNNGQGNPNGGPNYITLFRWDSGNIATASSYNSATKLNELTINLSPEVLSNIKNSNYSNDAVFSIEYNGSKNRQGFDVPINNIKGNNYVFNMSGAGPSGNDVIQFDLNTGKLEFSNSLKENCGDPQSISIIVKKSGGGQGNKWAGEFANISYGNKTYTVGFAIPESDAMHIYNGTHTNVEDENIELNFVLGAGTIENGSFVELAPQAFYDAIQNVVISVVETEVPNVIHTIGVEDHQIYGVNTKLLKFKRDTSVAYEGMVKVDFDFVIDGNSTHYYASCGVGVKPADNKTIRIPESMSISDINEILKSRESFRNFLQSQNITNTTLDTRLTIVLPAKEYNGILTFNTVDGFRDYYNTLEIQGSENETSRTTIRGGINNQGGLSDVVNISFIADDNYKIEDKKVAFYAHGLNYETGRGAADAHFNNCSFEGYDIALWSTETGFLSGIKNCNFKNNEIALFFDCGDEKISGRFSDNNENTFINNNISVYIKDRPEYISAYSFSMQRNYFYNSIQADFKVCDKGTYHFMNNYYGTKVEDYGKVDRNGKYFDVRSAKVDYSCECETGCEVNNDVVVATNPAVRYPADQVTLGIDTTPGLHTIIYSGEELLINRKDLTDLKNALDISICNKTSEDVVATLTLNSRSN